MADVVCTPFVQDASAKTFTLYPDDLTRKRADTVDLQRHDLAGCEVVETAHAEAAFRAVYDPHIE